MGSLGVHKMTEWDLCKQWWAQACDELIAPLARRGAPTVSHRAPSALQPALLQALTRGDIGAARQICQRRADSGQQAGDVSHLLSLILPLIEQIERDWQADRRSYTDTLDAFWGVQRLLQSWGDAEDTDTQHLPIAMAHVGRVLVASVPGSLHHFGTLVVADRFRTHGWQVQTLIDAPADRLLQAVTFEAHDVVGLSVGHDAALRGLPGLIHALRGAATAPGPRILLGGHAFADSTADFDWLGADGIAPSAHHALTLCGQWVQHKHH
jgi:methylmalonyl-CoA mutase cobalamin-binding subunit